MVHMGPPTDHPVSKVGTQQIQRLFCGMGWGSILLKPICFSSQLPLCTQRPPEPFKDLYVPLCVYREGVSWVILKPESSDDAIHAHCYLSCASHRPCREDRFPSRHCSSSWHAQRGRIVFHPKTKCQSESKKHLQSCRWSINTFPLSSKYELSAFVSLGFRRGEASGHPSECFWGTIGQCPVLGSF